MLAVRSKYQQKYRMPNSKASQASLLPTDTSAPPTPWAPTDSRSAVLARIRASGAHGVAPLGPGERKPIAARRGPAPELPSDTAGLLQWFEAQSLRLSATVERLDAMAQIPAAVAAYADRLQLPRQGVCWPSLAELGWDAAGLNLRPGPASREVNRPDALGVSGVLAAVAETGTLLLASSADAPASLPLLPETHIAVVRASQVVATMEDAFVRARALPGGMPRSLNFISGPSRTADIEQTLVLGAHGPYRVHILLMESL